MNKPPMLFIAVLALIVVLATQRYFSQRKQEAENDRAPVRSTQVIVSEKRAFPASNNRSRQREHIVNEAMRYEITFRPQRGGENIVVRVKQPQYEQIEQGAQGSLKMQGTRFVSFTAERP
ncbi:DUF2500 domain-containing protein [Serratia sp. AKBS12]|uniref:DUF2500 domain-containing protein n=1 Tax=Serratia sp. AKBS12 TaxID=2974597 RepID=UPI002164F3B4|nr:DUF2500 domain-containing protein [Serratia sp. AKBS12]MCS3406733.1 DUF2500 domain-containing protein [Serratia sp. AKBS12]HEI8868004.1 DUF2500 domain-containing protein [Serratia odorifera]